MKKVKPIAFIAIALGATLVVLVVAQVFAPPLETTVIAPLPYDAPYSDVNSF